MRSMTRLVVVVSVLLGLTGCSYLFYPRASEYLERAKGASGVETMLNLATMLDASTKAARSPEKYQTAMDDLHNQFHALKDAFCQVTEQQAKTPTYTKAAMINKEMGAIFMRLWRHRTDQASREVYLDLFGKRLQELRETLQVLKS